MADDFQPKGLIPDWSAGLAGEHPDSELEAICPATGKGMPCASKPFIEELERLSGVPR